MPQLRREMSWLSPKRRRTTGNLRTDMNGKTSGESTRTPGSTALVRPSAAQRTVSQPVVGDGAADGDLCYAYARKESDSTSSHLLTFASASVANEFWMLLQLHFPKTSRPEAQQFIFHENDTLAHVWKHPSFAHLQSKWMYIVLPNGEEGRVGGAPQKTMFAQDVLGELFSGSTGGGAETLPGRGAETRETKNEIANGEAGRLEEYLSSMVEALQRNTEKAAELSAKIQRPGGSREGKEEEGVPREISSGGNNVFDMDGLSNHLTQLNKSLQQNSETMERLTDRQIENDHSLRSTLEALSAKQNDDRVDMQRLYTHVDHIQSMMEEIVKDRRDSARVFSEHQIDFSPLTFRLEKMQDAVEQNSALLEAFKTTDSPQMDISPLTQSLDRIHMAVEQQSEHTKALVGFASADGDGTGSPAVFADGNLAPLSEHLEQIYNVIEEGNRYARESRPEMDIQPLRQDLEALHDQGERTNAYMERLLEVHEKMRDSFTAKGNDIDFKPLAEHLEAIKDSTATNTEAVHRLVELHASNADSEPDFSPVASRLDSIYTILEQQLSQPAEVSETEDHPLTALTTHLQTLTEQNSTTMRALRDKQNSSVTKMQNAVSDTSAQIRQLVERKKEQDARMEAQNSQMREMMSGQRELVEVVRQLAKNLAAQNRETCGHVVVPPPRKMNRKLVGFVYDAKEGGT